MPIRSGLALAASAALALACGGEDPVSPVSAALIGEWRASPSCAPPCAFTLTSVDDPSVNVDLIEELGVALDLGIGRSGSFSLELQLDQSITLTGTARTEGDLLIVTGVAGTDTVDYAVEDDLLTLDFRQPQELWDFDEPPDSQFDLATVRAVLRRR